MFYKLDWFKINLQPQDGIVCLATMATRGVEGRARSTYWCLVVLYVSTSGHLLNGQSVDRVNFGVTFHDLDEAYVETSMFQYDLLINLPSDNVTFLPDKFVTCHFNKTVLGNSTQFSRIQNQLVESSGVKCSSGLMSLMLILHNNQAKTHFEIIRLVQQIHLSLPSDLMLIKSMRPLRAWFGIVGKAFQYLIGTATTDDVILLSKRITALEA